MAVSRALRFQILRRDNHTCRYCGRSTPEVKLTVDHVNPEALGGSDDPTNLVTACADCNGGKSATPPDAALIAQVDEDAIRWSRARQAAAQKVLADFDARKSVREQFRQNWNRWTVRGAPPDLPNDWEQTVDRFISLGLPLPLLMEATDITMGRKVKAGNAFNYMCGIAWNRVREIDEQAANSLTGKQEKAPYTDPEELMHIGAGGLAGDLLNLISERHGDEYYEEILDEILRRESDSTAAVTEAIKRTVEKMNRDIGDLQALSFGIGRVFRLMEPEFRKRVNAHDERDSIELDEEILREAANQLAFRHLESLPKDQRACWLKCAETLEPEFGWDQFVFAATASRQYAADGTTPSRICGLPAGEHLICPEASMLKVTYESCPLCPTECAGHSLCMRHGTKAIEGKLTAGSDKQKLTASSITEIDQNDPWR